MKALTWPLDTLPQIYAAGRYPLDDKHFRTTWCSVTHALHLYDYSGQVRIGEQTFSFRRGDLTFTPAGTNSAYHLDAPGHHLCVHFQPVPCDSKTAARLPLYMALGPRSDFVVGRILHIIHLHMQAMGHSPASRLAEAGASAALQELLIWLAMQAQATTPIDRPRRAESAIDQLLDIINARLADSLTVPMLASEVNLTQNYLARLFRQRFGMTIPHYLLTRRIELARDLLATTDLPIKKIAARVGLPDSQHFNKQFRRLIGTSPTESRASARNGIE